MDHGEVVGGELLIAGCDATELLETIDQALDGVAGPVSGPIHQGAGLLTGGLWDDRADPASAQIGANGLAGVGAVGDDAFGSLPWPSTRGSADRHRFHQYRQCALIGRLPWAQYEGKWQAVTVGTQVELRREAAPRAAKCLGQLPPFAPAACWWARTTVLST